MVKKIGLQSGLTLIIDWFIILKVSFNILQMTLSGSKIRYSFKFIVF